MTLVSITTFGFVLFPMGIDDVFYLFLCDPFFTCLRLPISVKPCPLALFNISSQRLTEKLALSLSFPPHWSTPQVALPSPEAETGS